MRLGKISGRRRPGTGPAPRANVKTNLDKEIHYHATAIYFLNLTCHSLGGFAFVYIYKKCINPKFIIKMHVLKDYTHISMPPTDRYKAPEPDI